MGGAGRRHQHRCAAGAARAAVAARVKPWRWQGEAFPTRRRAGAAGTAASRSRALSALCRGCPSAVAPPPVPKVPSCAAPVLLPAGFAKVEKRVRTAGGGSTGSVRNLRIREDTAKYLLNLDVNSGGRAQPAVPPLPLPLVLAPVLSSSPNKAGNARPRAGTARQRHYLRRCIRFILLSRACALPATKRTWCTSLRCGLTVPPHTSAPPLRAAYYDPKSRSMREDPNPEKDPSQKTFYGDNFVRQSGEVAGFKDLNVFAITTHERGQDVHMQVGSAQRDACSMKTGPQAGRQRGGWVRSAS